MIEPIAAAPRDVLTHTPGSDTPDHRHEARIHERCTCCGARIVWCWPALSDLVAITLGVFRCAACWREGQVDGH